MALTPLTLSVNFRSQRGVVEWVNRAFTAVMPDAEDLASGAVPYVPCVPSQSADTDDAAVHIHALGSFDRDLEARRVAEIVQWEKSENPNKNMVLLVRARGHLRFIAQALRDAGHSFQAVEIEPLGPRAVVQDLTVANTNAWSQQYLYVNVSVAQGAAATVDLYIYGDILTA